MLAEHALPVPTPMTVMGEQFRPRRAVTSPRRIPSKPRMRPPDADLDCARSQTCLEPSGVFAYIHGLLATLDAAGAAALLASLELDGGGGRKEGKAKSGDSDGAGEEHCGSSASAEVRLLERAELSVPLKFCRTGACPFILLAAAEHAILLNAANGGSDAKGPGLEFIGQPTPTL